jgi:hypothetical protein
LLAAFSATADGFTTKAGITVANAVYTDVWTGHSYDGTKAYRYNRGARPYVEFQDAGTRSELMFYGLPNLSELYLSFRMYQPDGTEGTLGPRVIQRSLTGSTTGVNAKFLRLRGPVIAPEVYNRVNIGASTWTNTGGGSNTIGQLGTEFQRNYGGFVYGTGEGGDSYELNNRRVDLIGGDAYVGRWVLVQFQCRVASAANNDGLIRILIDGVEQYSRSNLPFYAPLDGAGNYFTNGYIMGDCGGNNAPYPEGQFIYLDDIRFSVGGFA